MRGRDGVGMLPTDGVSGDHFSSEAPCTGDISRHLGSLQYGVASGLAREAEVEGGTRLFGELHAGVLDGTV